MGGHVPEEVVDSAGVPYIVKQTRLNFRTNIKKITRNERTPLSSNRSESFSSEPWCPSMKLSLKLFLTVRLSAAVWSTVADCDETYNYWEPMHFLLYGKGFQVRQQVLCFFTSPYLSTLILVLDMGVFAQVQPPVVPLHPLAPAARVDIRQDRISPSNVSWCECVLEII